MDPCDRLIAGGQSSESEDNLHYDQQDQSNGETLQRPKGRFQGLSHNQRDYGKGDDCKSSDDMRQRRDETEC